MADTNVDDGFKVCKRCLVEKPMAEFHPEPRVKSGTTAKCRDCTRIIQSAWAKENPERIKASRERYAKKFPERVLAARNFTLRRLSLERKEKRIADGTPLLEPRETDDGRLCSKCRRRKPAEKFPPNIGHPSGLSVYCRECVNRAARDQSKKPKTVSYRRRYMRAVALKKYGLTIEQFDELIKSQDGKCLICEEVLKVGIGGCAVDHDHTTKRVRGLLCRLCNVGVGHFRDNPAMLRKAAEYLEESERG